MNYLVLFLLGKNAFTTYTSFLKLTIYILSNKKSDAKFFYFYDQMANGSYG